MAGARAEQARRADVGSAAPQKLEEDLIDFGQHDDKSSSQPPTSTPQPQLERKGQPPKEEGKEKIPEPEKGEPGHSLIQGLERMKMGGENKKTEGMGSLRRLDSETNESDEFVDAES